jgi:hypothetical protein
MDAEYQLDAFETTLGNTLHAGDCVPIYWPNLGPDLCATVFGAELEFGEQTSWSTPIVESIDAVLDLQPNLDNPYWQTIRRMTDLSLQRSNGRWVTSLADLHTNGDLVAALRGPENLCIDMIENPEGVKAAAGYVTDSFELMYDDLYRRFEAACQPVSCMGAMFRGRMYVVACDFIALIGPDMFAEAIQPAIQREVDALDRAHFHLDGPGALRHLDALLEMPQLRGVQWVYGAGGGPATQWLDVYKRIQAAGRCMEIIVQEPDHARQLMQELRPEGVWFNGVLASDLGEANALLDELTAWAKRG